MADKSMDKVTEWMLVDRGLTLRPRIVLGGCRCTGRPSWGHEEVLWLLLERGADVEAKDNYERTALLRAAGWGDKTVA